MTIIVAVWFVHRSLAGPRLPPPRGEGCLYTSELEFLQTNHNIADQSTLAPLIDPVHAYINELQFSKLGSIYNKPEASQKDSEIQANFVENAMDKFT